MLSDNPKNERIFHAARLDDEILEIAKKISISSQRPTRLMLLKKAEAVLDEMQELAVREFDGKPFILGNLEGLRGVVRTLADLPLAFHGNDTCPACGEPLVSIPTTSSPKLCSNCIGGVREYRLRLASDEGFRTEAI